MGKMKELDIDRQDRLALFQGVYSKLLVYWTSDKVVTDIGIASLVTTELLYTYMLQQENGE